MALPVVAYDESGNSGQNLLDPEQPLFVLAAVSLDETAARSVLEDIGAPTDDELKFSELRASDEGQRIIRALVAHEAVRAPAARASIFVKPWMLAAKFVDVLVEPWLAERQRNMYAGGMHLTMANRLFLEAPVAVGAKAWTEVQQAFVMFMRRPSPAQEATFREAVQQARAACRVDAIAVLFDVVLAQPDLLAEVSPNEVEHQLDPAPTALVEHAEVWSQRLGPHVVVHEHSKAIEDWLPHIEALANPEIEPTVLDFGHVQIHYPLLVREIRLADSRSTPAIQIADLLAGALASYQLADLGARPQNALTEELRSSQLPELIEWHLP